MLITPVKYVHSRMTFQENIKVFLFIIVTFVTMHNVSAQENFDTSYKIYLSGLHVANLKATAMQSNLSTELNTLGAIHFLTGYSNKSQSHFRFMDGEYRPQTFHKISKRHRSDKLVNMTFSESGRLTSYQNSKSSESSSLNLAKTMFAFDPLTAFMEARYMIRKAINDKGSSQFSVPIYDGKTVANLAFKVIGQQQLGLFGKAHDAILVEMKRQVVDTHNQHLAGVEFDDAMTLYLSDNDYLMPLKIEAKTSYGHAVILINEEDNTANTMTLSSLY